MLPMLPFYLAMLETDDDRIKFQKLYEEHSKFIHNFSKKLMNYNSVDGDDVEQCSYEIIIKNIRIVRDNNFSELRTWVGRVVQTQADQARRKQQKDNKCLFETENIFMEDYDYHNIPETYTLCNDGVSSILQLVGSMKPLYKNMFLQRSEHYSHKEIARLNGITEDNSKQIYLRVKKELQKRMKEATCGECAFAK